MVQEDLLIKIIDRISQINIPYMITGAIASSFYGKPRLTHDFDIIVKIGPAQIQKLVNAFKDEFYISEETIQKAIDRRTMFNLIHFDSGIKVDFWLIKEDDFDKKRFQRRQKHTFSGRDIYFTSPEDLILIKSLWHKESKVQKHFDDAYGVSEVQQELDMDYLKEWAVKLSIKTLLDKLLDKV